MRFGNSNRNVSFIIKASIRHSDNPQLHLGKDPTGFEWISVSIVPFPNFKKSKRWEQFQY